MTITIRRNGTLYTLEDFLQFLDRKGDLLTDSMWKLNEEVATLTFKASNATNPLWRALIILNFFLAMLLIVCNLAIFNTLDALNVLAAKTSLTSEESTESATIRDTGVMGFDDWKCSEEYKINMLKE